MAQTPLPRHFIAEHARFSAQDRVQIARCRRAYNRLGFAYQLAFLRLMGRFPHQQPLEMHEDLLAYVAQQLDLDASEIPSYAQRQATASAHADQLRVYLGYHTFGEAQRALLVTYIREEVEHLEQTAALMAKAEQFLRRQKILLPARWTLRRLIIEERAVHREHLLDRMMRLLPEVIRVRLDRLLLAGDEGISPFQGLKEAPGLASPRALLQEIAKLTLIEETGILELDIA